MNWSDTITGYAAFILDINGKPVVLYQSNDLDDVLNYQLNNKYLYVSISIAKICISVGS